MTQESRRSHSISSRMNVARIMKTWTDMPGYPVIHVKYVQDGSIQLTQVTNLTPVIGRQIKVINLLHLERVHRSRFPTNGQHNVDSPMVDTCFDDRWKCSQLYAKGQTSCILADSK